MSTPRTDALIAEFQSTSGIVRAERLRAMSIALVDLCRTLESGDARVVGIPAEPTPAMIEAGEALVPWSPGTESRRGFPEPAAIYRAMVAAASPSEVGRHWTPVGVRMPDDGVVVLVRVAATPIDNPSPWIGSGRYACDEFDGVRRWEVAGWLGWGSPHNVTHWMPLPADDASERNPINIEGSDGGPLPAVTVAVESVVAMVEKMAAKCDKATDLHKGMRMALGSVIDGLREGRAVEPPGVGLPPMACPPPTELEMLTAENANFRAALKFYAEREHYAFSGEPDDWEAPSGEPQNWLCAPTIPPHDKGFDPSWMIEDGGVARAALAGESVMGVTSPERSPCTNCEGRGWVWEPRDGSHVEVDCPKCKGRQSNVPQPEKKA